MLDEAGTSRVREAPRLRLAHLPTPIIKLKRLSPALGKGIYVWRDDLTGFTESGNKIRKLEFLLADALQQNATRIITCGAYQSNHTRAAVFACRRLGLEVSLIVRKAATDPNSHDVVSGNALLNRIAQSDVTFISTADYERADSSYLPFLEARAERSRQAGECPYVIDEGGSAPIGCLGYVNAVNEMLIGWQQTDAGTNVPDSVFFAEGSGGTHAGLYLGFRLNRLPPERLWAINVCNSAQYFERRVSTLAVKTAEQFHLPCDVEHIQVLDGHVGAGYAIASDEDLRFCADFARFEGLLLDPVYTGKAFRGMLEEIANAPDRFGSNILFLHSGGGFSLFGYAGLYQELFPD